MIFMYLFLVVGVIFLWMLTAWNKTGYFVYLWQVKQYRFDRMRSQLLEPDGLRILASRFTLPKVALALAGFLALAIDRFGLWFYYAVYLLYAIETLLLLHRARQGKSKFPVLTAKSLLLMLGSFFVPLFLLFALVVIPFLPGISQFLLMLLVIDVALPLIVSVAVAFLNPFTFLARQYVVKKAIRKRGAMKRLIAIGISGNVGKTSTKEFLAHILSLQFMAIKTSGHQNTEIGAARALLRAPINAKMFVAEMGAYRKGDIAEIAQVVKPSIGIITSLGDEHLSLFGSLEGALETEFELARLLPASGHLIVNGDNEFTKKLLQDNSLKAPVFRYSLNDKKASLYASRITQKFEEISFDVHYKNQSAHFYAALLGKHNVSNILAATSAALLLGMKLKDIASAVAKLEPLAHTMRLRRGIGNLIIIDDSYNASPQAIEAAFDYLKIYKNKTRIAIMPSLIELGQKAQLFHEDLGKLLAENVDWAIITDTHYREAIEQGWKEGKGKDGHLLFQAQIKEIAQTLEQIIDEKSVILIEGRVAPEISYMLNHHFYEEAQE